MSMRIQRFAERRRRLAAAMAAAGGGLALVPTAPERPRHSNTWQGHNGLLDALATKLRVDVRC